MPDHLATSIRDLERTEVKIGERSSHHDLRGSITSFGLVLYDASLGNQMTSIQSFKYSLIQIGRSAYSKVSLQFSCFVRLLWIKEGISEPWHAEQFVGVGL